GGHASYAEQFVEAPPVPKQVSDSPFRKARLLILIERKSLTCKSAHYATHVPQRRRNVNCDSPSGRDSTLQRVKWASIVGRSSRRPIGSYSARPSARLRARSESPVGALTGSGDRQVQIRAQLVRRRVFGRVPVDFEARTVAHAVAALRKPLAHQARPRI